MYVPKLSLAKTGAVQAHQRGGSYETGGVDAGIRRRLDVVLEHSAEPLRMQRVPLGAQRNSIHYGGISDGIASVRPKILFTLARGFDRARR
jgi:hypothetical protein